MKLNIRTDSPVIFTLTLTIVLSVIAIIVGTLIWLFGIAPYWTAVKGAAIATCIIFVIDNRKVIFGGN